MSIDLNNLIQNQVGGLLSSYAASALGENPANASKLTGLVVPALLGKLGALAGDHSKAAQLFNLVSGPQAVPQIDNTLTSIQPNVVEQGRGLLSSLFGDTSGLVNLVAGKAGVGTANTGTMMAAALPLVLGVLRNRVQTEKQTQPQFIHDMSHQRGIVERVLGGDFLRLLGWGTAGAAAVGTAATAAAGATTAAVGSAANVTRAAAAAATAPAKKGGFPAWLWLVLAAILGLLALKFCGNKNTPAPAASSASAPVVKASAAPASAAASAPVATASAASAAAAPASAASAANVAAHAVYEKGVLSVYFDTSKTDVPVASADKVSQDVVKAGKDGKKLVVSGFNDPRGNAAMNAELSKNRAKAVKEYLISKGVKEANIELRKPADHNGDAGVNQLDRRVDVTVE